MGKKRERASEKLTEAEVENRATEALRRALATPPKPQSNLRIGKSNKKTRLKDKKSECP